ncbi:MAG: hypothetical protein JST54_27005 [Deltaproteobacteria bacterium]|nr:hypothetical protein [Deltaproteobacteria bacterium]
MARFFNLESLAVLVACLVMGVGGAFASGLDWPKAIGMGLVFTVVAFLIAAPMLLDKLIEVYAKGGKLDRALDLAISARDSAPSTGMKNVAQVDVALLHLLRRDFQHALDNLEGVRLKSSASAGARAVVQGHTAYCLAHLNRDLPRADELARSALKAMPDEPIFMYFVGLVLLVSEKAAEAEPLLEQSIQKDPDPTEPYQGERYWALARARVALGKDPEPAKSKAIEAGGHFAEQAKALGAPAQSAS